VPTAAASQSLSFAALSIAFTSTLQGWVLGEHCTGTGDCTAQVRLTHDGGRTYEPTQTTLGTIPAGEPNLAEALSISFTDASTGWVTGLPRLLVSRDGGHSWTDGGLASPIAVAPLGAGVWVQTPDGLYASDDRGATWRLAVPDPGGAATFIAAASLARLSASDGFAVLATGSITADDVLIVTRDGWRTWTRHPIPCRGIDPGSVAAVRLDTIWLACGGGPSAGQEGKLVAVAHDSGATWQTTAEVYYRNGDTPVGNIGGSGYVERLTVRPDGRLFLTMHRRGPIQSSDGTIWTDVPTLSPGGEVFSDRFDFPDVDHGWVISGAVFPQPLWSTTDGGLHWTDLGTS
jgi:Photosynthesis system II assembly factor YCF48